MQKTTLHQLFILILSATLLGQIIIGCSGGHEATKEEEISSDSLRDAALERYLNGQTLDQRGDYASAILEYQDALRFFEEPAIYFALAKDYSLLGKHELAVEAGNNAVRLEPGNLSYREQLAEIFTRSYNFKEAVRQYEEIIRRDSSRQETWYEYANVLQAVSPLKSLEVCEEILDRFGPDESIYFQMVQLYTALEKYDKAAEALKGMLTIDPTNFDIKKSLGDLYMEMDSVDAALQLYDELAELHPENVVLRASIAHAYLLKRDYAKAREQFDSLITKDTLSIEDQLEFGKVFITFVEKDSVVLPLAEEMFQGMVKQYPDDWRPYWMLGAIANVKRDDSMSVVYFKKVTELAKWNPDGWVGVASVWFDKGDMEKAISVLEDARQNVKEDFRIEFIYGLTLQRMRRATEAAMALERAIQVNPKSLDALSALGLVYDELKRYPDSDTMYERALRINPKSHLVLNNYGYSLTDRGVQLERAETMIKEALEQQPNNGSYLDSMGWICFRLGKYEEAELYIKKAIEFGNTSPVIYEHLGDTYSKMNQKEKAQEYWKKALEKDSANETLKAKIERGSL
ncbi:MAG: tetratricopeptide repeat protein [Bacteroidetes bacterium]|nr:MAG: tetratricopeptide repeat protein [Bacteroidota bacterium]